MNSAADKPRIAVVGGGLAGMAAAAALAQRGVPVTLLEAKRWLGGRAGSFEDPATGETVDHCQHVAMGCCTNFLAFCRRTGIARFFRRDRTLYFFSPEGRRYDFAGWSWLPAPGHLLPSLYGLGFLSRAARLAVVQGLRALVRRSPDAADLTVQQWLAQHRQGGEAIERFWTVVLVSALGESLDRASVNAARKVFVDGFMSHRDGYHVLVPTRPLVDLYEQHVLPWLIDHGVTVRKSAAAARLIDDGQRITGVQLGGGENLPCDHVVVALAWRAAARVLRGSIAQPLSEPWQRIETSPITGVHLWFDRPITDLPHAVLVGRLSQWLFSRSNNRRAGDVNPPVTQAGEQAGRGAGGNPHYYQVVISASRQLIGRNTDDIVQEVLADLRGVFPQAREAQLLQSRVVTQPEAVFSVTPQLEVLRPAQATSIPGFTLAGDWTKTNWPATMESAVRSGHLAAEAVLSSLGRPAKLLAPDLPASCLMRFV